ncbi:MAG TPA: response regulator [Chitinispirillaceae bacterium]|nr:response regulator [Chitinispirillaceae bacterium]
MKTNRKVLIVEDEAVLAMLYERRLKSRGYIITGTATTKEDAVRLAFENPPDFILIDIRLAGDIDGIDAVREITARISTRTIFMSGYNNENIKNKALELHPLAYLIKPFEIKELLSYMEQANNK